MKRKLTMLVMIFSLMVSMAFRAVGESKIELMATANVEAVINAPKEATVKVYLQKANYNIVETECAKQEINDDNTVDYYYTLPARNAKYTYRVSQEGKVTKAGYLNLQNEDTAKVAVSFKDDENPKERVEYVKPLNKVEDSILLNINEKNYLKLDLNEEFEVKAYRAWQIVNNLSSNIIIEPDFHYEIIDGDSITINQQGQSAVIKGIKEGISIVEVTYDAIEIGGNTSLAGLYGAIDPQRKGLFVVSVGEKSKTNIKMPSWDSDLDTVYFFEDSGIYNFKPECDSDMTVTVNNIKINKNSDNSYSLPINTGNNIVCVSADGNREFIVIKGCKITAEITNVTNPGKPLKQGDEVIIHLDGLHMPLPKMAAIYNPGYGNTLRNSYKYNEDGYVFSGGLQYEYIPDNSIKLKVYDSGNITLSSGKISLTSFGNEKGNHRSIPAEGLNSNVNAKEYAYTQQCLPDLTLNVEKNKDLSYMNDAEKSYCDISAVNIFYGSNSFYKAFGITKMSDTSKALTQINAMPNFSFKAMVIPANPKVTVKLRFWTEGDTNKREITLAPGETIDLGTGIFDGSKAINVELEVVPKNKIFGEGKTYSYVFYNSSAASSNPMLKNINITDESGEVFEPPYGILISKCKEGTYPTVLDYYTYIPADTDKITLNLKKFIGTSEITVNNETKTVGTSEVCFENIPVEGNSKILKISVDKERIYNINVIKRDGIYVDNIENDDNIAAIDFFCGLDKSLNLYAADYNNEILDNLITNKSILNKGINRVYLDISKLKANKKIFVWDDNLYPYTNKTMLK